MDSELPTMDSPFTSTGFLPKFRQKKTKLLYLQAVTEKRICLIRQKLGKFRQTELGKLGKTMPLSDRERRKIPDGPSKTMPLSDRERRKIPDGPSQRDQWFGTPDQSKNHTWFR